MAYNDFRWSLSSHLEKNFYDQRSLDIQRFDTQPLTPTSTRLGSSQATFPPSSLPHPKFRIPNLIPSARCPMPYAHWPCALCPMPYALCPFIFRYCPAKPGHRIFNHVIIHAKRDAKITGPVKTAAGNHQNALFF